MASKKVKKTGIEVERSSGSIYSFGLDISTSVTGWTLLKPDGSLCRMGHFDFKGCDTIWDKADAVYEQLEGILSPVEGQVVYPYAEAALMSFRPGLSSAATITSLIRFNGLVSYNVRARLHRDVEFIGSTHARKACGVTVLQKHPSGWNAKRQTFEWCISPGGPLEGYIWPKKRSGANIDAAMDETDSYIIARAGHIERNRLNNL